MIIHPINVGQILKQYGFDENVVSAGYLHDVVEDTSYEIEDIKDKFNDDIASLVYGASEPDKSLSWEERKKHTIEETKKLDLRHKAVICADKISNLEDLKILFEITLISSFIPILFFADIYTLFPSTYGNLISLTSSHLLNT